MRVSPTSSATPLATSPPGPPLTALRLDDESLAEGNLPDRDFIDRVVSDRPVLLILYCGHVAVANPAALALAGIDATTPDPRGGAIDRDSSGRPTGVVRETAAEPVGAALRAPPPRPPWWPPPSPRTPSRPPPGSTPPEAWCASPE